MQPIEEEHPYIIRDNNKCVLCGLCIRTCEEVMSVSALGLLDRGFQSSVEAGFGVPLLDSSCIGCGQCVAVCPTGALIEKQPEMKTVPLATEAKPNICNFCGLGCQLEVHQHGELPVKVTPTAENELCASGRFGYPFAMSDYAMTYPLLREKDELLPADWADAYLETMKQVQALQAVHGRGSVGVVIGDKLSTEEIFLARHLAHDLIGTERIYSANATTGGLADVLGQDGSTNSVEELLQTDLVLVIGTNVIDHYPMLGTKLIRQGKKGLAFALLNDTPGPLDQFAVQKVSLGEDLSVLKQIAKMLWEKCDKVQARYGDEFAKALADVKVTPEAQALAECYANAKHAMILFDRARTTRAAAQLIADIAFLSGHLGKPRNGIMQLRPRANTQGLVDMGVRQDMQALRQGVAKGDIKGLLFFGHDADPGIVGNLDFLLVADTASNQAMPYADVILPLSGFASVTGSFTNFAGKVQMVEASIAPATGLENWQILAGLIQAFPKGEHYQSLAEIRAQIADWYPNYRAVYLAGKSYASMDGEALRFHLGYPFLDGLAHLMALDTELPYYREIQIEDISWDTWVKARKHYGLTKNN